MPVRKRIDTHDGSPAKARTTPSLEEPYRQPTGFHELPEPIRADAGRSEHAKRLGQHRGRG